MTGVTELEKRIQDDFDNIATETPFDALFDNTGYITVGYYKHDDETIGQSARNITERLGEISGMSRESHVLDLGCGSGRPALDLAVKFGCSVVGLDLSPEQIKQAQDSIATYRTEHKPDIKAEFFTGSFFDLPLEVTSQRYSHVIMQTSLFFAHHNLDYLFGQIAGMLKPGGKFLATDFYRHATRESLTEFMEFNGMTEFLTLDEMKAALERNQLRFVSSENMDHHCIKCHRKLAQKMTELNFSRDELKFCEIRAGFTERKEVSFHILFAEK